MKLKDAYTILEIPMTSTPEEAKKRFKELAKKYHPDVNKDEGAEAKFKRINEAYQVIESGVDDNSGAPAGSPFGGWHSSTSYGGGGFHVNFDPFRDPYRGSQRQYYGGNIDIQTTVSFKESVLGVKKELKYSRQIKCPHCKGSGDKHINNGCKTCKGQGQVTSRRQNAVFIQTCPDCGGRAKTEPCTECSQNGVLDSEASVTVSIPNAVHDKSILRLAGMGNFNGSLMGLQDTYTDVYVHISVEKDNDLRLEGKDVVSEVNISLLDALRGCDRKIRTIDGLKKISITPQAKNKDEVVLSVGDHNSVKHRVIINVGYPTNIDKLIDALLEEGK
jgi:molecular chaperone DnaJ